MTAIVPLGTRPLTTADVAAVADGAPIAVSSSVLHAVEAGHGALLDLAATGTPIYGLTTGVGDRVGDPIGPADAARRQLVLLASHASGVGEPWEPRVVRAITVAVAQALAHERSGVRATLVARLVSMLNAGVVPCAPRGGSVGYLIATAHIGLVAFGRGRARFGGELLSGAEAMRRAGIPTDGPGPREGLALISGVHEISGLGALAVTSVDRVLRSADVAAAMSLEALRGTSSGSDARAQAVRPHPGQAATADRLRALVDGSGILAASRERRLQDALSLRAVPQVHGAARDMLAYATRVIETDLNSVTDNPAFVDDGGGLIALPNANGHGAPGALALDALAIAVSQFTSMSQARTDRLTTARLSGLPPFLVDAGGDDPGLMIPAYAAAALSGEVRHLASPASVHSVSTSAGQEDHISQGVTAADQAVRAADLAAGVIAIELLCAAQGLEFATEQPGRGTAAARALIRSVVPAYAAGREPSLDIAAIRALVVSGELAAVAEAAAGLR
ncbi:histidine ammonia-lyase [uncultured Amnibacterium sp.]|uniref:HAL/PAL/TAL family ammonia-lyase n=1 Tax=uncultured Amnibacterium sp. TaxID=1631851 RepID=UPI0035CB8855